MKNLFVPYEIALKLKEKGFDEDCIAYYPIKKLLLLMGLIMGTTKPDLVRNSNKTILTLEESISAPLYQQIVDWFRDKHNINISVININNALTQWVGRLTSVIFNDNEYDKTGNLDWDIETIYPTYYEALNKTIEEALKLINHE